MTTNVQQRPTWMGKPTVATKIAKAIALIVTVMLVLIPFSVVIAASMAKPQEVIANGGYVIWPKLPTRVGYRSLIDERVVTKAMLVSIGVTVVGTALAVVCTVF